MKRIIAAILMIMLLCVFVCDAEELIESSMPHFIYGLPANWMVTPKQTVSGQTYHFAYPDTTYDSNQQIFVDFADYSEYYGTTDDESVCRAFLGGFIECDMSEVRGETFVTNGITAVRCEVNDTGMQCTVCAYTYHGYILLIVINPGVSDDIREAVFASVKAA